MGGSIAVTLRLPDGTEHRMCRWTNILPWALTNIGMIESKPEHVTAFMKQWLEMKSDWEKSQADGTKPEHAMTSFYAPYPFLAPEGYGLVVIDMVNKVILHSQNYTSVGTIFSQCFHGDPEEEKSDPDSDTNRFKALFDAGKITEFRQWGRSKPTESPIPKMTAEAAITSYGKSGGRAGDFIVNMSPYKVERFMEHDYKGSIQMKARVEELGFVLSPEEEALWNEWFEACKEME